MQLWQGWTRNKDIAHGFMPRSEVMDIGTRKLHQMETLGKKGQNEGWYRIVILVGMGEEEGNGARETTTLGERQRGESGEIEAMLSQGEVKEN